MGRAIAVGLTALGTTAAVVAAPAGAFAARPAPQRSGFIHGIAMSGLGDPPPRLAFEGERTCGGLLYVDIYRNGEVIIQGGDGAGVVTFVYNCQGNTWTHWTAVWSVGVTDEGDFPCS